MRFLLSLAVLGAIASANPVIINDEDGTETKYGGGSSFRSKDSITSAGNNVPTDVRKILEASNILVTQQTVSAYQTLNPDFQTILRSAAIRNLQHIDPTRKDLEVTMAQFQSGIIDEAAKNCKTIDENGKYNLKNCDKEKCTNPNHAQQASLNEMCQFARQAQRKKRNMPACEINNESESGNAGECSNMLRQSTEEINNGALGVLASTPPGALDYEFSTVIDASSQFLTEKGKNDQPFIKTQQFMIAMKNILEEVETKEKENPTQLGRRNLEQKLKESLIKVYGLSSSGLESAERVRKSIGA